MILTNKQAVLLLNIFTASISNAMNSGIPIGNEYYDDIEDIREKLYTEIREAAIREGKI